MGTVPPERALAPWTRGRHRSAGNKSGTAELAADDKDHLNNVNRGLLKRKTACS